MKETVKNTWQDAKDNAQITVKRKMKTFAL